MKTKISKFIAATVVVVSMLAGLNQPALAYAFLGNRVSEWNTPATFYCFGSAVVSGNTRSCSSPPGGGPRAYSRFAYPGQSAKCYGKNWYNPKAYVSNNFVYDLGGAASGIYYVC